jgi:hypothetical protein
MGAAGSMAKVVHGRAVQAVVWGIAAVNFDRMRQALLRDVQGAENQLVYWSQLADGKTQLLTPNTDALYIMPFFPGTRWIFPVDMSMARGAVSGFTGRDEYPVDARGLTYYWGFSSIKRAGGNQLYLFATRDQDGQVLDGGRAYH